MTPQVHPDTLRFFEELTVNNNREWFNDNKLRWTAIRDSFLEFTQQLIDAMAPFDPSVGGLSPKQCVYRIYRDLRFSPDKRPYKTHIACFLPFCGDRTQCVPGYYLQIGQKDYGLQGNCSLGGGFFMPSSKQLAAIRQEIFYCTDEIKAILNAPDYKRYYCDYCSMHEIPRKTVLSDGFFEEVVRVWKATVPLNRFIERALTN